MTRLLKAWIPDILKQQTGNTILFLFYGVRYLFSRSDAFQRSWIWDIKKYQSGCTFVIFSKIFTS